MDLDQENAVDAAPLGARAPGASTATPRAKLATGPLAPRAGPNSSVAPARAKRAVESPLAPRLVAHRPTSPLAHDPPLLSPSSSAYPALRDITNSARTDAAPLEPFVAARPPAQKRVALRRSSSRLRALSASKLGHHVFPPAEAQVEHPASLLPTDEPGALSLPAGRSTVIPDLHFQQDLPFPVPSLVPKDEADALLQDQLLQDQTLQDQTLQDQMLQDTVDEVLQEKLLLDSQPYVPLPCAPPFSLSRQS